MTLNTCQQFSAVGFIAEGANANLDVADLVTDSINFDADGATVCLLALEDGFVGVLHFVLDLKFQVCEPFDGCGFNLVK